MGMPLRSDEPFVLLDFEGRREFYRRPSRIVEVRDPAELEAALEGLRGQTAAGFIGYECGYALEPALRHLAKPPKPDEPPLLWFGVFEDGPEVPPDLPDEAGAWAGSPRPLIDE